MYQGLDNVGIAVADIDEALEYYETLGFEAERYSDIDARVDVADDGAYFYVYETEAEGDHTGRDGDSRTNPSASTTSRSGSTTSTRFTRRSPSAASSSSASRGPRKSGGSAWRPCRTPPGTSSTSSPTSDDVSVGPPEYGAVSE